MTTQTKDMPPDFIGLIHRIVVALTVEKRVRFQTQPEGGRTIIVTPNFREFGRICGKGGQTINDLNMIAASLEVPHTVRLAESDMGLEEKHPLGSEKYSSEDLLEEIIYSIQWRGEPPTMERDHNDDKYHITCSHKEDMHLLTSIGRVMFNAGRTNHDRCDIAWNVVKPDDEPINPNA